MLAEQGENISSSDNPQHDRSDVVYIDPIVFGELNPTVQCYEPCTLIMPLSRMSTNSIITYALIPTYHNDHYAPAPPGMIPVFLPKCIQYQGQILIEVEVTTSVISFLDLPISSGETSFVFNMTTSFQPPPQTLNVAGTVMIITPKAQSTHYGLWDSTEPTNTVLPTTIVTSNGKTQTFSEDQITSLTGLTATTKVTTTLSENGFGTTTSTATVIDIIFPVTKSAFYWSPVPELTVPEYPIPTLPDFPPVPSPTCFKLGNLFSTDCPPNNNKAPQTTQFTPGPNSPSLCSNCGHLPSKTDSSSSSSCTTQTVTSCRTYTTTTPF